MVPERPKEADPHDLAPNSPEALGLAPIRPEQGQSTPETPGQETPASLQEQVQRDISRNERAPEILARIENLAEANMPIEEVLNAHPELRGIHLTDRFHATRDNKLIFFTGEKAYLLPATTTFETGEGSIFPTEEDKALFDGSITTVLESAKYIDSTPIIQHLAVYRFLNLNDPNRETALKAALEQAEKTLDSIVKTLKPEVPAETAPDESDEAAPPGSLETSSPSAQASTTAAA